MSEHEAAWSATFVVIYVREDREPFASHGNNLFFDIRPSFSSDGLRNLMPPNRLMAAALDGRATRPHTNPPRLTTIRRKPRLIRGVRLFGAEANSVWNSMDISQSYNDTHNRLMTLLRGFLIW
ncbi:hypothetical protein [Bifidobacterium thermacidophilum]|uniref:hypothetical protein n=1 Tax=Bifidobacterium thermacidophilum TaxID=246618 RepID=UPI003F02C0F4